jgi:hypothetical protein
MATNFNINIARNDQEISKVFVFPEDLVDANKGHYPDVILITIVQQDGANLKEFQSKVKPNLANDLRKGNDGGIGRSIATGIEKGDSFFESVVNVFKGGIDELADKGKLNEFAETTQNFVKSVGKTFKGSRPKAIFKSTIALPMPDNLTYNEQIEWQAADLGAIGGLAKGESTDSLAGAGFSQLGSIISGGAGALVSGVLGGGIAGGAVLGALGGGSTVQGTIESQLKIRANPFKEQTFQGIPFRPFEFSWTFSPTSEKEVRDIKNIINQIRGHSKANYGEAGTFFFKYPHEFDIRFLTFNDEGELTDNEYLPKLKNCICKSVNTNFATAGWYSFKDGAPTSITLQLQFEEIEIITKDDVLSEAGSEKPFINRKGGF